jgi:hypothetical protein
VVCLIDSDTHDNDGRFHNSQQLPSNLSSLLPRYLRASRPAYFPLSHSSFSSSFSPYLKRWYFSLVINYLKCSFHTIFLQLFLSTAFVWALPIVPKTTSLYYLIVTSTAFYATQLHFCIHCGYLIFAQTQYYLTPLCFG